MLRFIASGLLVVISLLALFASAADWLDLAPRTGAVLSLRLITAGLVAWRLAVGTWLLEAIGLMALFLLIRGRCGAWWLDGVVAGCLAWIFRGPLLVITIVVATGQPQAPWWRMSVAWLMIYVCCGIALTILAARGGLVGRGVSRTPGRSPESARVD